MHWRSYTNVFLYVNAIVETIVILNVNNIRNNDVATYLIFTEILLVLVSWIVIKVIETKLEEEKQKSREKEEEILATYQDLSDLMKWRGYVLEVDPAINQKVKEKNKGLVFPNWTKIYSKLDYIRGK